MDVTLKTKPCCYGNKVKDKKKKMKPHSNSKKRKIIVLNAIKNHFIAICGKHIKRLNEMYSSIIYQLKTAVTKEKYTHSEILKCSKRHSNGHSFC